MPETLTNIAALVTWPVDFDGEPVISLLIMLLCTPLSHADGADSEFDFLEEGERNRERVEADRAPNASIFLEEEDDAENEVWEAANSGSGFETDEFDPDSDFDEDGPDATDDPLEDMTGLGPDLSRLLPLGDHFDLNVEVSTYGPTVAELPLLIAREPGDIRGNLWVVADFYLNGNKTGESRHLFTPESASDLSPTYAWLKSTVPLNSPGGIVEVRVFAAPEGKKEALLFTRKATFTR